MLFGINESPDRTCYSNLISSPYDDHADFVLQTLESEVRTSQIASYQTRLLKQSVIKIPV